jgi:hypothetical protein
MVQGQEKSRLFETDRNCEQQLGSDSFATVFRGCFFGHPAKTDRNCRHPLAVESGEAHSQVLRFIATRGFSPAKATSRTV